MPETAGLCGVGVGGGYNKEAKAKGMERGRLSFFSLSLFLSLLSEYVSMIMMEMQEVKQGNAGNSCTNGMMGYETVQTTLNLIRPLPLFSSDRVHGLQLCNLQCLQSQTLFYCHYYYYYFFKIKIQAQVKTLKCVKGKTTERRVERLRGRRYLWRVQANGNVPRHTCLLPSLLFP